MGAVSAGSACIPDMSHSIILLGGALYGGGLLPFTLIFGMGIWPACEGESWGGTVTPISFGL